MKFEAIPTISVIKKEEKEAKLKAFIVDHFSRRDAASDGQAADRVLLLIARSHESPVVRALAGVVADSNLPNVTLKALVLAPGNHPADTWPASLSDVTDLRITCDLRLLDAHEQLWLDAETAWIGDCMRREPSKRDAYECYAHECQKTAKTVETSFHHLWEKGHAIVIEAAVIDPADTPVVAPHLAQLPQTEPVAPTASTRH